MSSNSKLQSISKLHSLAQQVVKKHPVLSEDDGRFGKSFKGALHDPFAFTDMKAVIDRLVQAVKDSDKITVFADFDTDGIPAAAMLHDLFVTVGHEHFTTYIPQRDVEGFGLKPDQVANFIDDETDLLITVDCGIRSQEAIAQAREAGVDVIVFDHHVPAESRPEANLIINPALAESDYPFADLAGGGVVLKVLQALQEDSRLDLPANFIKGQLGLAAVATISDMVPLVGENHTIAQFGLKILRNTTRPGLNELYEKGRIQGKELTEVDVGFTIGSHINAASRLDRPKLAYELLTTRNHKQGKQLADTLHKVYRKRKRKTASLKTAVSQQVDVHSSQAIVDGSSGWKPALLGPVAHQITDTTNKPVFLWGQANGRTKGSARATGHDVVSMLQTVADDLVGYGGHKLAGGFELPDQPTLEFQAGLDQAVEQFQIESTDSVEPVPAELADLDWPLYTSLETLGPFGAGCPQPLFYIAAVQVDDVRTFGSDNGHVGFTVSQDGVTRDTVAFFADESMKRVTPGDTISMIGALEKTTFGFEKKLRFRMESVSA